MYFCINKYFTRQAGYFEKSSNRKTKLIYPESFEKKVGFDRIRELLAEKCLGPPGKERCEKIYFSTKPEEIRLWIGQADEFKQLIETGEPFPLDHYFDLRPTLEKMRVSGYYPEPEQLFNLKRSLETIRSVNHHLSKLDPERFTRLKMLATGLKTFPAIHDRIDRIMSPKGMIRDKASPELAHIRKTLANKENEASGRIHSIIKQAKKSGLVGQDELLVVRDGRLVIPVDAGKKRKIGGTILDESATGKTVYIEPAEIVELNNEIRELGYAEKREIIRILIEFSDFLRPYLDDLNDSYNFLGLVDFIRAKALMAKNINGIKPSLSDNPGINWQNAVHPLLCLLFKNAGKKVVPLDIGLTSDKRILVISGPNAGGKSVCLQTIGLLQYMLQCGLLVPMDKDSKAGIFDHLFIHMGDDQSIDNDLSTYSSHLVNMKYFIKNANDNTLILIDEFGTGTEPMLGGAIAESILAKLNETGTYGVVTTHYTNLKHFAASTDGIENGAMLFDNHLMEPLFRLETGKPGSSFAFEIARKIGLPEDILQEAQKKAGKEHIDFDKHLKDVVRDKRYWERKRDRIRISEKKLEEIVEKYSEELDSIKKFRKEIIEKAKLEAEELLNDANRRIENTIREIKEARAEKEKTRKIRKELDDFKEQTKYRKTDTEMEFERRLEQVEEQKKRLRERRPDIVKEMEKKKRGKKTQAIELGDMVKMEGMDTIGEVLEITKKSILVSFGNMIITADRKKLEKVRDEDAGIVSKTTHSTGFTYDIHQRKLKFKPEIDIRGQRADEALQTVTDFIDEAIMVEEKDLRILHGKGDGVLRRLVRDYLQTADLVKRYHDEHVQRGGTGITVVKLDL